MPSVRTDQSAFEIDREARVIFGGSSMKNGVVWRFLCLLLLSSTCGCDGCSGGNPFTEYGRGYSAGVKHCREAKQVGGPILAQFNSMGADLLPGSALGGESADYTAGYREGYRVEAYR